MSSMASWRRAWRCYNSDKSQVIVVVLDTQRRDSISSRRYIQIPLKYKFKACMFCFETFMINSRCHLQTNSPSRVSWPVSGVAKSTNLYGYRPYSGLSAASCLRLTGPVSHGRSSAFTHTASNNTVIYFVHMSWFFITHQKRGTSKRCPTSSHSFSLPTQHILAPAVQPDT